MMCILLAIEKRAMYNGCNEEGVEEQGCKDEALLYSVQKIHLR